MAGVGGALAQVRLVGWLRWRVLRNVLRTSRGQMELVGTIITLLLGAVFALGGALGLAAAAYVFAARGGLGLLHYLYWAVIFAWQLLPVLAAGFSASFDFRHLLHFPLRFRTFFLLHLAYGLADPASLVALAWLGGISVGVTLARPELAGWVLLAAALFALFNVFLNRLVFSWLEKLLARRRTREILFVVFLLAVFGIQFGVMAAERWLDDAKAYADEIAAWTWMLPPGLAGMTLERAAAGALATPLSAAAVLGAYAALFGWLLARRLRAQYRGEELGESRVAATAAEREQYLRRAGWELPGVSGPVAALVEKELRYLLRNYAMLLNLFAPLLVFAMLAFALGTREKPPEFLTRAPELIFPGAIAYALLLLSNIAYNAFAFDGRGVQLLLVSPVSFREVMLGKNLATALLLAVEFVLLWVLVGWMVGPPGVVSTAAALGAGAFGSLINFAAGNLLSLHYPRAFDFGKFRQRQAGMTAMWSLLVQMALLTVIGGVLGISYLLGALWAGVPVLLLLAAGAFFFHRWSLEEAARLALAKREVLVAELSRD